MPSHRTCLAQVPLTEDELQAMLGKPDKMAIGMEGGFQVRHRQALGVCCLARNGLLTSYFATNS